MKTSVQENNNNTYVYLDTAPVSVSLFSCIVNQFNDITYGRFKEKKERSKERKQGRKDGIPYECSMMTLSIFCDRSYEELPIDLIIA
jgi:hypothetical protein